MSLLFTPIQVGDLNLPNRVIMAPLTRCRASEGRVPNPLMAEYYAQRASAGLILTEATSVMPMGVGYPDTPGIWSAEQIEGWQRVTQAVHAAGGRIFMQLWHVGRVSHPDYLDGALPVAPSALAPEGHVSLLRPKRDYVVPRALETGEIPAIVEAYRQGAINAKAAGFDGVELHGANGYLLDQFLQDSTNRRTDRYGGSIENRARLLLEVTDAAIGVWGAGRVGVRISPLNSFNSMIDSDPLGLTSWLARRLNEYHLAYLHLMRGDFFSQQQGDVLTPVREQYTGVLIGNMGYSADEASAAIAAGQLDAVAFGTAFLANPDLPERIRAQAPLNAPDPATFYSPGPAGYTDYPFWSGSAST